jgi:hypothetical protein
MAAGLGFKDFVTGEVLTAADVDGYLMQGVWVFASAAARDSAVTSPQEGNFAYLKDTNVTTYYTGSAWANLDTTGMTNPMTTTGDTIYSSSGSTPARLGIGSTGNVLTVAGGVPTWAAPAAGGGMTLLSTTTLTGSTVDISSIDQTYTDLVAVISDVYMDNDTGTFSIRFNTISTGNYTFNTTKCNSTYATLNFGHSETAYDISGKTDETTGRYKLAGMITMPRYASATNKFATHQTLSSPDGSAANVNFGVCNFQTTSGISTITFRLSAGTFSGGTVYLYGVK